MAQRDPSWQDIADLTGFVEAMMESASKIKDTTEDYTESGMSITDVGLWISMIEPEIEEMRSALKDAKVFERRFKNWRP